jgi:tartrate-resistant acid phosphatase type 5
MKNPITQNRRRFLKTAFCSSALLGLNVTHRVLAEGENAPTSPSSLELIILGDFGSAEPSQWAVAKGMQNYVQSQKITPHAQLLLGDNFYKNLDGGLDSPRWKEGFEDAYPSSAFPGPCYAILGNHDYHDTDGGQNHQLGYAAHLAQKGQKTRWSMPAKWYRVDLPAENPVITILAIDTNLDSISGSRKNKDGEVQKLPCLTPEEEKAQAAWLEAELQKPRAPHTLVIGHHPLYSNGAHGDKQPLIDWLSPLLEKNKVSMYLCGHEHDLQHLRLEGLTTSYVISGGGGARVRPLKREDRRHYAEAIYGFSHLSVTAEKMTLRHLDPNAAQVHAFSRSAAGEVTIL